jgi:hypothetical protein
VSAPENQLELAVKVPKRKGWIGVDLDGTLAEHEPGGELYPIGKPIPGMVTRVKCWLRNGYDVRVFTARACDPDPLVTEMIKLWCIEHIGQEIPVTNSKDYHMRMLYDDRAFSVERNTGRVAGWMEEP